MNKTVFYFIFSFLFFFKATAQKEMDSLFFDIQFKCKSEALKLNKNYVSNNDTLQVILVTLYISGIEMNNEDRAFLSEFITHEKLMQQVQKKAN